MRFSLQKACTLLTLMLWCCEGKRDPLGTALIADLMWAPFCCHIVNLCFGGASSAAEWLHSSFGKARLVCLNCPEGKIPLREGDMLYITIMIELFLRLPDTVNFCPWAIPLDFFLFPRLLVGNLKVYFFYIFFEVECYVCTEKPLWAQS